MAEVRVDVDAEKTLAQLEDMMGFLAKVPHSASRKGAAKIKDHAERLLSASWHMPGSSTTSPPGAPPAKISGHLAGSLEVHDAGMDGHDVGPTAGYGRIQELGGWMQGHPLMHWWEDGRWHKSAGHSLPARPYMRPAREASLGEIRDIFAREVREAIRLALDL